MNTAHPPGGEGSTHPKGDDHGNLRVGQPGSVRDGDVDHRVDMRPLRNTRAPPDLRRPLRAFQQPARGSPARRRRMRRDHLHQLPADHRGAGNRDHPLNGWLCDFCRRINQTRKKAVFVLVTGEHDTMQVQDWLICTDHADQMNQSETSKNMGTLVMARGIRINDWELRTLNDQAEKHYLLHPRRTGESG
jgi:hypothetical protein